jgi:biopolymer transport protein ExbB
VTAASHRTGGLVKWQRAALAAIAAFMLLPSGSSFAQDDDEEAAEKAAQEEAAARAKAEAEERRKAQVFATFGEQIRQLRTQEAELLQQKAAEAREELAEQERLAAEQIQRRDRAEANSKALDAQWDANEARIDEISALLQQHQGNLGELFGVTRQIAGDAAKVLQESLISTQFQAAPGEEQRSEFMRRLAGAKALPSIRELERLWFEVLREMTESGKVVRYQADIKRLERAEDGSVKPGAATPGEVVRVGPFTATTDSQFLGYLSGDLALTELDGQLGGHFRSIAGDLSQTPADAGYTTAVVDPARGALLGLYLERPTWLERIGLGEAVGYVIIALGVIGVLVAIFQYGYLLKTRLAVSSQLKNLSQPRTDNPLGRLLMAYYGPDGPGGEHDPENVELAELRLSEAVLREIPKLERFQSFLRLAVAAGPLLGLIGTVIGMIITFHAIVASGSSDPKLMAHGIGVAMIATVLGLGIAIPLLFINAGLTAFSRGITQILDEQSEALLAEAIISHRNRYA